MTNNLFKIAIQSRRKADIALNHALSLSNHANEICKVANATWNAFIIASSAFREAKSAYRDALDPYINDIYAVRAANDAGQRAIRVSKVAQNACMSAITLNIPLVRINQAFKAAIHAINTGYEAIDIAENAMSSGFTSCPREATLVAYYAIENVSNTIFNIADAVNTASIAADTAAEKAFEVALEAITVATNASDDAFDNSSDYATEMTATLLS